MEKDSFIVEDIHVLDILESFLESAPIKKFNGREYVLQRFTIDNNVNSGGHYGHCDISIKIVCPENGKRYTGTLFKKEGQKDNMYNILFQASGNINFEYTFQASVLEATDTNLATRDYFAGQALSALLANKHSNPAEAAFVIADQMMEERKNPFLMAACRCVEEPRGRNGLEGYCRNEIYYCEYREKDRHGKPYWRIWPDRENEKYYYETCGPIVFKQYFNLL